MDDPSQLGPTGTPPPGAPFGFDPMGQWPAHMAPTPAQAAYLYPPPYLPAGRPKARNSLAFLLLVASILLAATSFFPWVVWALTDFGYGPLSLDLTLLDLLDATAGEAWPSIVLLCMGVAVVGALVGGANPAHRGPSMLTALGFGAATAVIAMVLAAHMPVSALDTDDLSSHTEPGIGLWAALALAVFGFGGAVIRLVRPAAFTYMPPPVASLWGSPAPGPWGSPAPGPWGSPGPWAAPGPDPWGSYPYPPQQGWSAPAPPTPPSATDDPSAPSGQA